MEGAYISPLFSLTLALLVGYFGLLQGFSDRNGSGRAGKESGVTPAMELLVPHVLLVRVRAAGSFRTSTGPISDKPA